MYCGAYKSGCHILRRFFFCAAAPASTGGACLPVTAFCCPANGKYRLSFTCFRNYKYHIFFLVGSTFAPCFPCTPFRGRGVRPATWPCFLHAAGMLNPPQPIAVECNQLRLLASKLRGGRPPASGRRNGLLPTISMRQPSINERQSSVNGSSPAADSLCKKYPALCRPQDLYFSYFHSILWC